MLALSGILRFSVKDNTQCDRRFGLWCSGNGCAEGNEGQLCQLEALFAEGDTDDGDAPDQANEQEAESHFPTEQQAPDNIGDGVFAKIAVDGFAKGPDDQSCHFEALFTKGDTDDGDAKKQACKEVSNAACKTCENKPENVTDCLHEKSSNKNDMHRQYIWSQTYAPLIIA